LVVGLNLFAGFAVSAFAILEVDNGFAKALFVKVGPIFIGKIELRIRELP
jgi:hypothetical protein